MLEKLLAAIIDLTAALNNFKGGTVAAEAQTPAPAPKAAPAAAPKAAPKAAAPKATAPAALTVKAVQDNGLALIKAYNGDRQPVVDLLVPFNLKKIGDIDPSDAETLTAVNGAILAALAEKANADV